MTMSRSRSVSPRRSRSASPIQPTSPHSAAYEGEDYDGEEYEDDNGDFDDDELTHSEKVRFYVTDSPSPTGSPMEEDESLLNADELRSKLQEVRRQCGAEYVDRTNIKDVLRDEHARAETLANHLSAYEEKVTRIKKELATVQAELAAGREREAKKDEDLAAVQSKLESLGLSHESTTSLPANSESDSRPRNCGNYLQPRSKCRPGCSRVHVDDDVRV
ncbi:hypothetical protein BKA58DRAFT_464007 [Alternaria rosae]|uniref:uncharacterized protein n=1 Tax=Alternaria rosae TaxID=1187941 RepID=UPI001E8E9C73|nr:uncharacterized protein BKA58DRAFT_464007 [Alternaria rosae]KAH6881982.1 hypothetical protein BKA58DRAFT_464007 [Alternaria rosae]